MLPHKANSVNLPDWISIMSQQTQPRDWHLDKSIGVGHWVSTLTIAVSLVVWVMTFYGKVEKNALAIQYQAERLSQQEARTDTLRAEIRTDLRQINSKLDRLVERRTEQ